MTTLSLRQRPTVFGDDARRFWNLTWTLAVTEWRLRFYGSVLGVAWSIARPFLLLRRHLPRLHERRRPRRNRAPLPRRRAVRDGAVRLLRRDDERVPDLAAAPREPAAQDPLPAHGDPALGGGDGAAQPRPDAGAGVRVRAARRRDPALELARADPLIVLLATLAIGIGMLLAALYPRFRRRPDLGRHITDPLLRLARPVRRDARSGGLAEAVHAQPDRRDPDPGPARGDRPSAPTAAAIGGNALLLVPLAIVLGAFALGLWVFNREAPKVAERL